jgi:hypothetical protein
MDACQMCSAYNGQIDDLVRTVEESKLKAKTFSDLEELLRLLENIERTRRLLKEHQAIHENMGPRNQEPSTPMS